LLIVKYLIVPTSQDLWSAGLGAVPISSGSRDVAWLIADVTVAGLVLALAYGLWRGYPASRVVLVLVVAASLTFGIFQFPQFHSWWVLSWLLQMAITAAVAVLLLLPAASRTWFISTKSTQSRASNPDPPAKVSS
jgi:hypothetical protein